MSHHHYSEQEKLHLYEGDQSKLYSDVLAHHYAPDAPENKAKVKKIWMITLYLTIITAIEVSVGYVLFKSNPNLENMGTHLGIITFFLFFTLLKAYFIVKVFMHMGDETKFFQKIVLYPLIVLIVWLSTVLLTDSHFHLGIGETFGHTISSILGNHKP